MNNREAGKGDSPRKGANHEAFVNGWDRIFGKKEKQSVDTTPMCPYKIEAPLSEHNKEHDLEI